MDIAKYVGAVFREVKGLEHEGQPARAVIARRTYDTNREDLWDALTTAERIPRWFLPISGDLRLGGRYQFEGNAGGTITTCEPPAVVGVTWEFGGGVSWVTVRLAEAGPEKTELELQHTALVGDEMWDQYGPGAVGVGWDSGLLGMALYLAGDTSVTPATAMEWMASDEGKAFMRGCSEDWGRASMAYGTDEATALAAAARTTAAYTGEAPPAES